MATYSQQSNFFMLEPEELDFSIPEFLPGTTIPTPANAGIQGNDLDNTLIGDRYDNVLNGGGGNDRLIGGLGDDIYIVFEAGDIVEELAGQGFDYLYSAVSYVMPDHVEWFEMLGFGDITGTGNNAANTMIGYAGNNALWGKGGNDTLEGEDGNDILKGEDGNDILNGGTGADLMEGGTGNDTYYVDNRSDKAVETSSGGTADLVYTRVSYTLSSYIEKLYATGSSAINLTGNSLANTIKGNAGANKINGGAGNDTLCGGAGRDIFVFDKALSSTANKDRIMDWSAPADTIQLENAVFRKLTKTGTLSASFFKLGSKALDANDYIGYDRATGNLWYDANGNAAGGQVVFAHIGTNKAIAYNDFVVI